ncbi:MAG: tryptophan--tRNA ligase [Candidatus Kerfeldbacteria bacterium]|nr:tryptophan--tRNA ligase [Candidatus Kerfeldbacteria bacterium]
MKQRLFSGIQPSGELHIGNYIGAIKQWLGFQESYESFFCIVDLHAITVRQDPAKLREQTRKLASWYLACGIDPEKSTMFVQSDVPAHAQMTWVFNTFTQMGELQRMTQYKDKSKQHAENINVGLFDYPVLMAADILLYDPEIVPVGEDQKQHIELARDIATRMNNAYGRELFVLPKYVGQKEGARVMGLDNPEKKMSKSAGSEWNYILLSDTADVVAKKIKRAVTDTDTVVRAGDDKPALTNLLTIYSMLTGTSIADLEKQYAGKGYGDFKTGMAEAMIAWLAPLQEKYAIYMNDPAELDRALSRGAQKANAVAQQKLHNVYQVVGLGR